MTSLASFYFVNAASRELEMASVVRAPRPLASPRQRWAAFPQGQLLTWPRAPTRKQEVGGPEGWRGPSHTTHGGRGPPPTLPRLETTQLGENRTLA